MHDFLAVDEERGLNDCIANNTILVGIQTSLRCFIELCRFYSLMFSYRTTSSAVSWILENCRGLAGLLISLCWCTAVNVLLCQTFQWWHWEFDGPLPYLSLNKNNRCGRTLPNERLVLNATDVEIIGLRKSYKISRISLNICPLDS